MADKSETTILCRKCGAEGTHHCSMPGCPLPPLTDRVAFEDRIAFQFDAEGLLTVTIASVQHVLMPEEVGQLRNWLLSGEEFTQDD